jgi:hypothetical protein
MECRDCGTVHYASTCHFCERLREELLERLEPDRKATTFSVIAARGMFIGDKKRLRQLKIKEIPNAPTNCR